MWISKGERDRLIKRVQLFIYLFVYNIYILPFFPKMGQGSFQKMQK